ncbi:MAG TPA: chemotaxis protein CheW [Acidobacteriota bacterium]|nr:chemotaxis protein CheW [Acidobacteriota bacterium]
MQLLTFRHRDDLFCFNISDVSEVLDSASPHRLPRFPPEFDGIFQLRGRVLTLLCFLRAFRNDAEDGASEIIVFAEPWNHFALRVPASVETQFVEGEYDQGFEIQSAIGSITEGIFPHEEKPLRLLSPAKIISFANELVVKSSQSFLRALKGAAS